MSDSKFMNINGTNYQGRAIEIDSYTYELEFNNELDAGKASDNIENHGTFRLRYNSINISFNNIWSVKLKRNTVTVLRTKPENNY